MVKPIDSKKRPVAVSAKRPAAPPPRTTPSQSRAVTTAPRRRDVDVTQDAPPSFLVGSQSGAGISNNAADSLVPIVVILQDGNPEVKPRAPKSIEGAEASMIGLKHAAE